MSTFCCLKTRGRKFTIVELLIVVAIMGMILGIALPAFAKLMAGGGVSSGASSVASQLRYCRSYALSKRQYVAFIAPDDRSLNKTNNNAFRCFRAARVKKPRGGSSGDFEFVGWLEDSSWSFLTEGVYLEYGTNTAPVVKVDLEALGGRRQGDSLAVVFSPSGKPVKKGGSGMMTGDGSQVFVAEGFLDKDSSNGKGNPINDKSNPKNRLEVIADSNTGRIDVLEP